MPQSAFLKNRFDLTPSEARLVVRLVAGESLRSCAQALGIKYETVRTYLKSVFQNWTSDCNVTTNWSGRFVSPTTIAARGSALVAGRRVRGIEVFQI